MVPSQRGIVSTQAFRAFFGLRMLEIIQINAKETGTDGQL
jgi:hypothetical protein